MKMGIAFFRIHQNETSFSPLQQAPGHAIRLLVARAPNFTPAANPSTEPFLKKNGWGWSRCRWRANEQPSMNGENL